MQNTIWRIELEIDRWNSNQITCQTSASGILWNSFSARFLKEFAHFYVDKWLSKYLHGKRANYNSPKSVLHNLYMDFWDFLHCKVLPLFCSRSFWGCCSYFAGIICKTDLIFSRHLATGRRLSIEQVRVKTVWLMWWAKMLWGGQMLEFYQPDLSLLLQKCICIFYTF